MAGPLEGEESSVFNVMRTVDAAAPFDAELAPASPPLDCTPETSLDEHGTSHEIVCDAKGILGEALENVLVRAEISGVGDTDDSDTPQSPDLSCTTGADRTCVLTHDASSDAATEGASIYKIWRAGREDPPLPDASEARDEAIAPGGASQNPTRPMSSRERGRLARPRR